jgi:hypothetical protein
MRNGLVVLAILSLFSCQKEIGPPEMPRTASSSTDTSVIATVTMTCVECSTPDSTIVVYQNNTRNFVKGYLLHKTLGNGEKTQTDFRYDGLGKLVQVVEKTIAPIIGDSTETIVTWQGHHLGKIRITSTIDPNWPIWMNRNYQTRTSRDTLYITTSYGRPPGSLASSLNNDEILADTSYNRLHRMNRWGYYGLHAGNNSDFGYDITEKDIFTYAGNNISSRIMTRQHSTRPGNINYPSVMQDTSQINFTHSTSRSHFWDSLQKSIIGRELRLLCLLDDDSVTISFQNLSLTYTNLSNFNTALQFRTPVEALTSSYVQWRDGVQTISPERYRREYRYTFDSKNRPISIETYDPQRGQILDRSRIRYHQ